MTRHRFPAALVAAILVATPCTFAQSKRDPDVAKTLERAYPGSQTHVTGVEQINGVKVFNVDVTAKGAAGPSTAQVTEFGDFLIYAAPQNADAPRKMVTENVGQLFQAQPSDIQLYRRTSYLVDVPVEVKGRKQKQQTYQIRIDPVGRVLDIISPEAIRAGQRGPDRETIKDEKLAKSIEQIARDRFVGKEPKLERIAESGVPDFYEADFDTAAVVLNKEGQVLSVRQDVKGKEVPQPVQATLAQLVKSSTRGQRVEEEYYQFAQQSATGNAVVVKMRPDGDILDVVNTQAQKEEDAVVAKDKQKAGGAPAKKAN